MTLFIGIATCLMALAMVLPRTFKYLFAAPLIGCCVGGFTWGVCMMFTTAAFSFGVGGAFFLAGVVIAEIGALFLD